MPDHQIVPHEQWIESRKAFLEREKEFTRLRDELSAARRALPWEAVEKEYVFDTPQGKRTLGDLFDGRHQLLVYHFMYGPDWEAGCPACSFWVDNLERNAIHLAHRDIALVAIAHAPLAKLEAYRRRMGWTLPFASALECDFNRDFGVSFDKEAVDAGDVTYNYRHGSAPGTESPGLSAFHRDDDGRIHHTYSTYSRGLDMLNAGYHLMDVAPLGRSEERLDFSMAWLRRRDEY
jgi:predicted dithiol-disulfide oxidoreductase (DUF899 family)